MKKLTLFSLIVMFISCGGDMPVTQISLENLLNSERIDEAFVLTREQLKPTNDVAVPIVVDKDGNYVPCQLDDLNDDGQWDELAFVYSMQIKEKSTLNIKWIRPENYPEFTVRANVHFGKMLMPGHIEEMTTDMHGKYNLSRGEGYPYQTDGPSWESDKMGFRHYFDGRNCRDVFGKRVPDIVLDTVGIRPDGTPGDTYHVLREWGRDIMSAANSFGLGGLALQTPDSLVRLGILVTDIVDNVDSTCYTLITKGPVRAMFKLDFYGWDVGSGKVDVNEVVTIWAGKYGYENKVTTSPLPENTHLVTGIVTNNNDKEELEKNYDDLLTSMITHDKQTYNKEYYMGMALLIPDINLINTYNAPKTGPGIIDTWCALLQPDNKGEYNFNVYSAWELGDEQFKERENFISLIDNYAALINSPVQMVLK